MNIEEAAGWKGRFFIEVFENGVKKDETTIENRLTNLALNLMRNALYGDTGLAFNVNYLATGSSAAAVDDTDTQLTAENFRVAIPTLTKTATGILDTVTWLLAADGAITIREIGVFINGTAAANSGTMLSRILYTRDKTALESIRIGRTDMIGRG